MEWIGSFVDFGGVSNRLAENVTCRSLASELLPILRRFNRLEPYNAVFVRLILLE